MPSASALFAYLHVGDPGGAGFRKLFGHYGGSTLFSGLLDEPVPIDLRTRYGHEDAPLLHLPRVEHHGADFNAGVAFGSKQGDFVEYVF